MSAEHELTQASAFAAGDFIRIVKSLATSPDSENISQAVLQTWLDTIYIAAVTPGTSGNLLTSNGSAWTSAAPAVGSNGWVAISGTFSYASASTINISAGGAAKYSVGDRLKWITATGSTQRYGIIVTVADTLLTVAVNTDHVLANEAWTLPYYSHEVSPVGFPGWFNVTAPTFNVTYYDNGSGGQPTTTVARFTISGRTCFARLRTTGTKAGANNVVMVITTNTFPTPATLYAGDTVGASFVSYSGVDLAGAMGYSTQFFQNVSASIPDNTSIVGAGCTFTYEI